MSDFNNNQNNIPNTPPTPEQTPYGYNPTAPEQNTQPAGQPVQPPFTPPVQNPQPQYPPFQNPAPQPQPQQPVPSPQPRPQQQPVVEPQPAPGQPVPQYEHPVNQGYIYGDNRFAPPVSNINYQNPNYAYVPKAAPKERMSPSVKAFVIIVISILAASLIGFIIYIGVNSDNSSFEPIPTDSPSFTIPSQANPYTEPSVPDSTESGKKYDKSDAQKETNPKFAGLKLHKKPSAKAKSGTQYSFNKVENSVVGIIGYTDDQEGTATSYSVMGSGIIVTSDGYIVTNSHIVLNSRTAYLYKVITSGKKSYDAGVVGYDSRYDLAVLKINARNLPVADFGNSDELKVAEDVIAIGNPRSINYQNSVTKGIVSAINRQASTTNNARFIQTDTPINPGNSGGPLCNMYGQVVGITTSKIALDEYEGMGFAIPSNTVKKIADSIIKYGYVKERVKIGIIGEITTKDIAGANGILISEISKGGPMDNTGAEKGDVITKVDGKNIFTFADVYDILEKHKAGDKIKVTLYRPDTEKNYDITVKLQEDKT